MAAFQILLIDASNELTSGGTFWGPQVSSGLGTLSCWRISNDANNALDKPQLGSIEGSETNTYRAAQ